MLRDIGQAIIRIGVGHCVEAIDLRALKADRLQIEVELQIGEALELLAEHPLIPAGVPAQAVVGDQEGHALRLGEMTQPNSRYGVPPQLACGQKSPVARDDLLLVIDQERDVESKRLDALSDLANLFVAMNPRVSRVGFQGCSTEVGNLQWRCRRLHLLTSHLSCTNVA